MVNRFLDLFSVNTPKWDNIADLSATMGWTDLTSKSVADHLKSQGVSEKYINEVVEAASRVNYGQNANYIHALEGACGMAANGAVGIAGGNFQLYEQFLNRSGAKVYLNTPVSSIDYPQIRAHTLFTGEKHQSKLVPEFLDPEIQSRKRRLQIHYSRCSLPPVPHHSPLLHLRADPRTTLRPSPRYPPHNDLRVPQPRLLRSPSWIEGPTDDVDDGPWGRKGCPRI